MYTVQQITNNPLQQMVLLLQDGTPIQLTIQYLPTQFGWFIQNLSYGNVTIQGLRICTSPNILYQWKNLLPFGLACFTQDNQEPTLLDDFTSNGRSTLYILSAAEVLQLTELYNA